MNSDTQPNPLKNKTILIVDDYAINVELLKIFVQDTGALALSAVNGVECLNVLEHNKIDMILMDLNMPEMNGLETSKAIRAIPQIKDIIIIGVIGYEDQEEIDLCRQSGMNDAIPKFSFNPEKLIELGRTYFSQDNFPSNNRSSSLTENTMADINYGPTKSILNFDKALKEFENDTDLLLSLIKEFTVTINKQMELINRAFQENEVKKIELEAHSIKGGAANLSADYLSDAARELEIACRTSQSKEVISEKISALHTQIIDFNSSVNK